MGQQICHVPQTGLKAWNNQSPDYPIRRTAWPLHEVPKSMSVCPRCCDIQWWSCSSGYVAAQLPRKSKEQKRDFCRTVLVVCTSQGESSESCNVFDAEIEAWQDRNAPAPCEKDRSQESTSSG
eukprot:6192925-Pleurochrysis_carterae.AAC.2